MDDCTYGEDLFETRCSWLFEGVSGVHCFTVDTFVLRQNRLSDLHFNSLEGSVVHLDRFAEKASVSNVSSREALFKAGQGMKRRRQLCFS